MNNLSTAISQTPQSGSGEQPVKRHHELSKHFKSLGLLTAGVTMNELLVATYKAESGCKDFRTFKQWKQAGYNVRKGSKGYPVFSRPIGAIKQQQQPDAEINSDLFKLFGTCYLFNESQVEQSAVN